MKYQSVAKVCLMIALFIFVATPILASSSKTQSKVGNFFVQIKQSFTSVIKSISQLFKGSKAKTVQSAKNTKQGVKKGFKKAKTQTVKGTKKAGQSVKRSFKGAKSTVKKDTKSIKQKFVNGFKSLKK